MGLESYMARKHNLVKVWTSAKMSSISKLCMTWKQTPRLWRNLLDQACTTEWLRRHSGTELPGKSRGQTEKICAHLSWLSNRQHQRRLTYSLLHGRRWLCQRCRIDCQPIQNYLRARKAEIQCRTSMSSAQIMMERRCRESWAARWCGINSKKWGTTRNGNISEPGDTTGCGNRGWQQRTYCNESFKSNRDEVSLGVALLESMGLRHAAHLLDKSSCPESELPGSRGKGMRPKSEILEHEDTHCESAMLG